ncbi:MAG: hypothetical protein ABIS67_03850, partial [Candidatus Eisenbacteria bacterium]
MKRAAAAGGGWRAGAPVAPWATVVLAAAVWALPAAAQPHVPKATEISYYYDIFDHSLIRPISRQLDPVHVLRKISARPKEAANVDERDQVRLPSTWWQPRAGFRRVTVEQMLTGPGPGTGPAPGVWTVTRAKTQGVTPGFFIKDTSGARFIIKFDPPANQEMATSADAISCVLYWACGYNVPDNTVAFFRPEDLRIADGANYVNERGQKRPMSQEFLTDLLANLPRRPDGTIRSVASRLLAGQPLGPFEYRGRRRDDPEDLIPHELRRELRGLWTIAAWTNHADVRGPNSLDMWLTGDERSFVRHYLIDFGSCLGSGALAARSYVTGGQYFVDYGVMGSSLATLGLKRFAWESIVDQGYPSIGFIEAEAFDPVSWRPDYPNPA